MKGTAIGNDTFLNIKKNASYTYLAQYGSSVGFPSLEKKPGNSTPSQNSVQQE